jgi:hypothetical protein
MVPPAFDTMPRRIPVVSIARRASTDPGAIRFQSLSVANSLPRCSMACSVRSEGTPHY